MDPVAPSQPRPRWGALLLQGCCLLAALFIAAVAALAIQLERHAAETQRKGREAAITAVELVVAAEPKLSFHRAGKNGIADLVIVGGAGSTNHEVEEVNYKKIRAVLAPLGPVKAVEGAVVKDVPGRPGGFLVEGTLVLANGQRRRFAARSSFRDLSIARWSSLEELKLLD